jgi:hypothetical protein
VAGGGKLAAYSCGGSRGIGTDPHRVPFFVPHHAGTDDAKDYSRPAIPRKPPALMAFDKGSAPRLNCLTFDGLSFESEQGTRYGGCSESAAAPATVSGEPEPKPLGDPGKAARS